MKNIKEGSVKHGNAEQTDTSSDCDQLTIFDNFRYSICYLISGFLVVTVCVFPIFVPQFGDGVRKLGRYARFLQIQAITITVFGW